MTEQMESIEDKKEMIKVQLAEKLMATIPSLPDDVDNMSPAELNELFEIIDSRASRVTELLGGTKARRGPARNPRGPRRSERFNTPELDAPVRRRRPVEE